LPDGVAYKMAHFSRTGRIVLATDELFKEASWFAIMMGQGVKPADYNPLLDSISAQENQAHLLRVKQQISAALGAMQSHEDHIRRVAKLP
jgi:tryptophan halogenase